MAALELNLELRPQSRIDVIDVRSRVNASHGDALTGYGRCLYCSFHTTAGFLQQPLATRLGKHPHGIGEYVNLLSDLFPEGAGYRHDVLDQRRELPAKRRRVEPANGDSHLAFIAGALHACVSYTHRRKQPVCFIDLDGVCNGQARRRVTRLIGYNREEEVARTRLVVPVSSHPIDAVNLKEQKLGLYSELAGFIADHDVTRGRVHLNLAADEQHASLTVNEYETLLMRHDLAEVLRNPLRFATDRARSVLSDPRAVPLKVVDYAKYDLVRTVNQVVDALRLGQSSIEWLLARALALPASRFLRMRRSVSMLVSDTGSPGRGSITQGTYQSPILVQWRSAPKCARVVDVTLTRFE